MSVQAVPSVIGKISPILSVPPTTSDILTLAGTFISYVTYILGIVTIIIAGGAIYFAWKFSKDRKQHLSELVEEFKSILRKDDEQAGKIFKAALENRSVSSLLEEQTQKLVDILLKEREKDFVAKKEINRDIFKSITSNQNVEK